MEAANPAKSPATPPPHGHHKIAPAHVKVEHLFQHRFQNFEALAGFALRHGDDDGIAALIRDTLGVLGRNAAVGHDGHLAVQPGELIQIFQRAVLQDDIIAALAQIHGELGSDKVAHLLYTPNSRTVRQVWFSSRSSAAVSSAVGSPTSST